MHWPGVVRVSIALLLVVLLVVLVATSEVVAKRGWWVFTTELVLPAFVGVAGTAVAAAAWLSSRRAAEIAEAALVAETNRIGLEARTALVRMSFVWLDAALRDARVEKEPEADFDGLMRELDLLPSADGIKLLLREMRNAYRRLDVSLAGLAGFMSDGDGRRVFNSERRPEASSRVKEARLLREGARRALLAWQADPIRGTRVALQQAALTRAAVR